MHLSSTIDSKPPPSSIPVPSLSVYSTLLEVLFFFPLHRVHFHLNPFISVLRLLSTIINLNDKSSYYLFGSRTVFASVMKFQTLILPLLIL